MKPVLPGSLDLKVTVALRLDRRPPPRRWWWRRRRSPRVSFGHRWRVAADAEHTPVHEISQIARPMRS